MNQKEKKEKKSVIGKALDLANGRYTDEEVNRLYDIVQNPKVYDGKTKTQKSQLLLALLLSGHQAEEVHGMILTGLAADSNLLRVSQIGGPS